MTRRGATVLCVALLAAALGGRAARAAGPDEAALAGEGRALYLGESRFMQAATVQGVALPGAACSHCHGARGEARSEAGVRVPSIRWQALMQPRDGHAAYADEQAVLRALEHGLGRQGEPLKAPMPRYAFTPRERRAMLAHLRVLATDAEARPGVAPGRVVVASVLPLSGPEAATGERIRAALAARFDAVNAAGGVYGRQIELRAVDAGTDGSRAAREVLQAPGEGVFAFVGSLWPEPDAELADLLRTRDVPMVATLGVPAAEAALPQVTHLLPSLAVQVRELVVALSSRCGSAVGSPVVLHAPGVAVAGVLAEAEAGWHVRSVADDRALADAVREAGARPLVALLAPGGVARVRALLLARGGPACLGTLAVFSGAPAKGSAGPMTEAVALPMPPLPGDGAAAGALWSTLADTAARVFVEALARAGRDVDGTTFRRALDTLHRYAPAGGPPVTYTPTRRHGVEAVYLWTENTHASLHP